MFITKQIYKFKGGKTAGDHGQLQTEMGLQCCRLFMYHISLLHPAIMQQKLTTCIDDVLVGGPFGKDMWLCCPRQPPQVV